MKLQVYFLGFASLSALSMAAAPTTPSTQTPDTKANRPYVASAGSDRNPGTMEKPFATVERAKATIRQRVRTSREPIRVLLREGTYYLNQPLEFTSQDFGTAEAPVTYAAYPGERVTLSGGRRLDCQWRAYQNGIMMCELPELKAGKLDFTPVFADPLFVNPERDDFQVRPDSPALKLGFQNFEMGKWGLTDEFPAVWRK